MTNIRLLLSKFEPANDIENDLAYFCTHVPWVAPKAYLNIVYKPLTPKLLAEAVERLRLPEPLVAFLKIHNGAKLFSGLFGMFGVVPAGTLLRRDRFDRVLPYSIESENKSWAPADPERMLKIGGYGWDGSSVCIDRVSHRIYHFRRGIGGLSPVSGSEWPSIDVWITQEIVRLSSLFDSNGRILVDQSLTVPSTNLST